MPRTRREQEIRRLESAHIEPRDVTHRFITEELNPQETKEKEAVSVIQNCWRAKRHAQIVAGLSFFNQDWREPQENHLALPIEITERLSTVAIPPLYELTSHSSESLLELLHDGVIYPRSMTSKKGISGPHDRQRGDGRLVCTSPSLRSYRQEQKLTLFIDELFNPEHGNSKNAVFYKVMDWDVLLDNNYDNPVEPVIITPKVELVKIDNYDGEIRWVFKVYSSTPSIFQVVLPNEEYIYHGYQGLNKFLTFFPFRVFEMIPDNDNDDDLVSIKQHIYDHFKQVPPEHLITLLQKIMRTFFRFPELDFITKVKLNFKMIKSLQLNKNAIIDFEELRLKIEEDDVDYFKRLFADLRVKAAFHQSYFIIKGICDYATEHNKISIKHYFETAFVNTLSVPESVEAIKTHHSLRTEGKHDDNTIMCTTPSYLAHTNVLEELQANSVSASQINNLVRDLATRRDHILYMLNNNQVRVKQVIFRFRTALNEIKDISELGFQTTLKQNTIDDKYFRAVLKNKSSCQIILYLASLGNDFTGLDDGLCEDVRHPLFNVANSFTGTKLYSYFAGIRNGNDVKTNNSILADILFNIPPISLFVADNGDIKTPVLGVNVIAKRVRCYQALFSNLKQIATGHDISLGETNKAEQRLTEQYDPKLWNEYSYRFCDIASESELIEIGDRCYPWIHRISAEDVIRDRLVLNPCFAHYCLDPKHLQSVLTRNYGGLRAKLLNIIRQLAENNDNPQDYAHRITGIQLFYRLKLLEYELAKHNLLHGAEDNNGAANVIDDDPDPALVCHHQRPQ